MFINFPDLATTSVMFLSSLLGVTSALGWKCACSFQASLSLTRNITTFLIFSIFIHFLRNKKQTPSNEPVQNTYS